jgi:tRNA U34 5-carboxymethylaminomethyl modifying GTPase MnmE/TrmE
MNDQQIATSTTPQYLLDELRDEIDHVFERELREKNELLAEKDRKIAEQDQLLEEERREKEEERRQKEAALRDLDELKKRLKGE